MSTRLLTALAPPRGAKAALSRLERQANVLRASIELANSYPIWLAATRGDAIGKGGSGTRRRALRFASAAKWGYEDEVEAVCGILG